ncbi:peptide MFS transporter [Francisellaceae bacterium CB299]|jgi:POT family proton-dependent oligopeptide transporter
MLNNIRQHPKGLWVLCGVEIWERFSYFGMRAILILFLTSKFWGMSDTQAYLTYGSYVAFVYMAPLIGGYISDTYLGHTTSVKYGCIFMMLGHLLLSLDMFFFLGLGFIVVGTGFFKSAMTVNIGELYSKENRHLKDSAYTLFYMAVNVGSAISVISVPLIAKYFGWHYGFAAAAFGMGLGLCIFLLGQFKELIPKDHIKTTKKTHIYTMLGGLLCTLIFAYLISSANNTALVLYIASGLSLTYLAYRAIKGGKEYLIPILAVIKISIIVMVFWALFEQTATSVLLFSKRFVDLNLFGFGISAGNLSVANSLFIILLSPIFATIWAKWNISVFKKMGVGLIFTGFAMGIFALAAFQATQGDKVPLIIIVFGYMVVTMGELCCSPTGLAAISKIAPKDIAALLFGVWGIKSGISNYMASYIATFTDTKDSGASLVIQAQAYYSVWFNLAIIAIIIGIIVAISSRIFTKIYEI